MLSFVKRQHDSFQLGVGFARVVNMATVAVEWLQSQQVGAVAAQPSEPNASATSSRIRRCYHGQTPPS